MRAGIFSAVLLLALLCTSHAAWAGAAAGDPNSIGVIVTPNNGSAFSFLVDGVSWSVKNPNTIGSATGGAGAGKAQLEAISLVKTVDPNSLHLFEMCVIGNHGKVEINFFDATGKPKTTLLLELAFVTEIKSAADDPDGPNASKQDQKAGTLTLKESITLVAGKLTMTVVDPKTGVKSEDWDFTKNSQ